MVFRVLRIMLSFILLSLFTGLGGAQAPSPLKQYFSIDNRSGVVIRRGHSDNGRIPRSLFLGKNPEFRFGVFDPSTLRLGNYSFTPGRNGYQLTLPSFRMRFPVRDVDELAAQFWTGIFLSQIFNSFSAVVSAQALKVSR